MTDTPNIAITKIAASQSQKHVTANEAFLDLDTLVQAAVINADLTTPPGSPAEGDRHIPVATATGDWAGQEGNIAVYQSGAWAFHTPAEGWIVYDRDNDEVLIYSGSAWASLESSLSFTTLSINGATADSTNRLAVSAPAVLLDAETDDIQMKLSKAATGDVASLLLQNAFSSRAEIGLIGDDDLTVKVTPDNFSTTYTAAVIDKDNGQVQFAEGILLGGGTDLLAIFDVGSWTPVISFSGGTTGIGYSTQTGMYVRFGDWVFASGRIALSSKGTDTGTMKIGGLPFAVDSQSQAMPLDIIIDSGASGLSVPLMRFASGTDIACKDQAASGISSLDDTNATNSLSLQFSGWYRTS